MRIYLGSTVPTSEQLVDFARLNIEVASQPRPYFGNNREINDVSHYEISFRENENNHLRTLVTYAINQNDPPYTHRIFYGDENIITIRTYFDDSHNERSEIDMNSQTITNALAKDPSTFTGQAYRDAEAAYREAVRQSPPEKYVLHGNSMFDKPNTVATVPITKPQNETESKCKI